MKLFKLLGIWSPAYIDFFTVRKGRQIGKDRRGNIYYVGKPKPGIKRGSGKERRWVIYKNDPDPATISPEWHGWLHHQTDYHPGRKTKK